MSLCEHIVSKNCVATASFAQSLDLQEILLQNSAVCARTPSNTITVRLEKPASSCVVFSSGQIVCSVTGTPQETRDEIARYFEIVRSVTPDARCSDIRVASVTGVGFLGRAVDLLKAERWFSWRDVEAKRIVSRSTAIKGLRFAARDVDTFLPRTDVTLFAGGHVVVTGVDMEELEVSWVAFRTILQPFNI